MGDDHSQRAYRSSESIARTGQPRAAAAPANDPLAELARLIGQNDPFGEGAQMSARLAESAGPPSAVQTPTPSFASGDFSMPSAQQHYGAETAGGQYSAAPPSGYYASEQGVPAYLMVRGGAEHAAYVDETPFAGDQDVYDDLAPPRRRIGLVFGLFALVVAGSAAAFGYHAMFGPAGTQGPPPVIKADTTPSKIVPERPKDSAKLINERVGDGGEKIVAREEKPVDIVDKITPAGFPPARAIQPVPPQASAGNGVIATEPRRVHTIVIRPDGEEVPSQAASAPPRPPAPQVIASGPPPAARSVPPARPAPPLAAAPAMHEPAPHVTRVASSESRPAPVRNAPLSLNPDAPAPRAGTRVANAEPPALASAPAATAPAVKKGGYAVQVSSQRSEQDAEAAFHALQNKYPKQLGGRTMFVHKVELGAKGTYYRALVGPFASSADASALCSSLKSAGCNCLIQRN